LLTEGRLPVDGCEQLDAEDTHTEAIMLAIRLSTGLPTAALRTSELERAVTAIDDGLLTQRGDRLVLTDRGRLLADGVVRALLD
jgi:oxygen-independent coproporphyrinogen-3 oxidase